jgi:hypothetical protein
MLEGVEPKPEPLFVRYPGGWRGVASAWALALLLVVVFAGVQALACQRTVLPPSPRLAGAVIPRHDPASAGVGIPCAAPLEQCGRFATSLVPDTPYPYPIW